MNMPTALQPANNNPPAVVNLKMAGGVRPSHDVYIGRALNHPPHTIFPKSRWANPYTLQRYGIAKALELYEAHVRNDPDLVAALPDLTGKVLGCWCKPKPCHGDILVKLWHEYCNIVVKFSKGYTKLQNPTFTTIRRHDKLGFQPGNTIHVQVAGGLLHPVRVVDKAMVPLVSIGTSFLVQDTDEPTREDAKASIRSFYPGLTDEEPLVVLYLRYVEAI